MGVHIQCVKTGTEETITYIGMFKFRLKLAELCCSELGVAYDDLFSFAARTDDMAAKELFYDAYNDRIDDIVEHYDLDENVVGFLYLSDTDGEIDALTATKIYEIIKDHYDSENYGYLSEDRPVNFADIKKVFCECKKTESNLKWY